MKSKLLRSFSDSFKCKDLGRGNLCIRTANPVATLWVRGAGMDLLKRIQSASCSHIEVDWGVAAGGQVQFGLQDSDGLSQYLVHSVIIHEALASLYDPLSLPKPDYRFKLLWRWLFAFARLPGGTHLIGILVRLKRRKG